MIVFPALGGWVHWLGWSDFSAYSDQINPHDFIWVLVVAIVLTLGLEYFVATSEEVPLWGSPEYTEYKEQQKRNKQKDVQTKA